MIFKVGNPSGLVRLSYIGDNKGRQCWLIYKLYWVAYGFKSRRVSRNGVLEEKERITRNINNGEYSISNLFLICGHLDSKSVQRSKY